MDYYSAWTISSVGKVLSAALEKSGKGAAYILAGGMLIGGYLGYKKIRDLENRVNQLEFQVKFGVNYGK